MSQKAEAVRQHPPLDAFRAGRDEMNLAEFPIASVAERFLDGTKTVVIQDEVWDTTEKRMLPRELAVSGSDRYGLPAAKDDDILLACIQLASLDDFRCREVRFSRYELLKLLRWDDTTRNYRRLLVSLRRWKGVTIYSNRAFYDHARKSWVSRDFGVIDNLYVYEREHAGNDTAETRSWFVWNEVVFESFRAGYLKTLDWDLYCRLKDPVAKRLYRFLDKRFYREDSLVIDLHELAYKKVRVSQNYNTAQVKRALQKGIRELECLWDICEAPPEKRFRKVAAGKWEAVFERKQQTVRQPKNQKPNNELERMLSERGVSVKVAGDLVRAEPEAKIRSTIELFDWYRSKEQTKGAGFIVAGIRSAEPFVRPFGMTANNRNEPRSHRSKSRHTPQRKVRETDHSQASADERKRHKAFQAFWSKLSAEKRASFESEALAATDRNKRDGYHRAKTVGGILFEHYQRLILIEQFERSS